MIFIGGVLAVAATILIFLGVAIVVVKAFNYLRESMHEAKLDAHFRQIKMDNLKKG